MGHVDTCYLAGVEDGYEHGTGLCTVPRSKKKKLCHTEVVEFDLRHYTTD
jgi:hypothetical protein